MNTDVSLVNGGFLRANYVIPKGPFKLKAIAESFSIPDNLVVKKMPGRLLHAILENAVSEYPKYEGRWPCVSGIKFKFDSEKPVG